MIFYFPNRRNNEGHMRRLSITFLVAAIGFAFAASAHSQSLGELARKEKARRKDNATTGKSSQVVVVDENALGTIDAPTFTAVQVTGAPESSSPNASLSGDVAPAPSASTRPKKLDTMATGKTPQPSSSRARKRNSKRGWSDIPDHTNGRGNRAKFIRHRQ